MPLSPQRRRRALKAHQLRQNGHSLRQIADHLQISHTAVHNDLQALETHRPNIIQAIADDKLLDHIQRLETRLERLLNEDPFSQLEKFGTFDDNGQPQSLMHSVPETQIIRYFELHERTVRNALTEYRLALRDLRNSTRHRVEAPEDFEADYLAEELADPEEPTNEPTPVHHQTLPAIAAPNPNLNGKPAPANQTPPALAAREPQINSLAAELRSMPDFAAELSAALQQLEESNAATQQPPAAKLTRQQRRHAERQARKADKRRTKTPAA